MEFNILGILELFEKETRLVYYCHGFHFVTPGCHEYRHDHYCRHKQGAQNGHYQKGLFPDTGQVFALDDQDDFMHIRLAGQVRIYFQSQPL